MNSELLAPIKGRLIAVILLSVLTAIATIIPLAGIVYIAKIFPDGNHQHIWTIVAVIIIAAIIRMVANGMSGMISHSPDNDLQLALRRQLVGHIRRVGWIHIAQPASSDQWKKMWLMCTNSLATPSMK